MLFDFKTTFWTPIDPKKIPTETQHDHRREF